MHICLYHLKFQTNWKSFLYSTFLWKFNIKVKNPPLPPLSSIPPFLQKIFHPHPYCKIWGSQSPLPPFIKGMGGSNYGKASFWCKTLKREWIGVSEVFGALFLNKNCLFRPIADATLIFYTMPWYYSNIAGVLKIGGMEQNWRDLHPICIVIAKFCL